MEGPIFVLVRPQMGENIGAAARAMRNFGLERMRIVAPRDGWPNPRAVAMASGAGGILDQAGLYDDLDGALTDCHHVLATTARPRELATPIAAPRAAMAHARGAVTAGERVAVLFGPERAGLENIEIARAGTIVSVPVDPEFPSLNLAQCALLLAYEWRLSAGVRGPDLPGDAATAGEIASLASRWETSLDAAGFFFPPEKAAGMRLRLRSLWSRLDLRRGDVQILHGIVRQLVRGPRRD